ncbi:hypothetical protein [Streptomyces sp. NPDC057686]|uniref:hypothetical protein n=1 Tax=Streptomyces sp. NPDC057686 TaxID=3346212 RepID=UPI003678F518
MRELHAESGLLVGGRVGVLVLCGEPGCVDQLPDDDHPGGGERAGQRQRTAGGDSGRFRTAYW